MKVKVAGRQQGKTTWLLAKLRADPQAVMVVHAAAARDDLVRQHPELQGRVFTAAEFGERARGRVPFGAKVYLDNADLILQSFFGNVVAATLTDDGATAPAPAGDDHLARARAALDRNLEKIVGTHRSGGDVPPLHRAVYEILVHLEDQQDRPKGGY